MKKATVHRLKSSQLSLPLWPNTDRALPSTMVRSALFRVLKRGKRKHVDQEKIASWKGTDIHFTGFLLDQSDLDNYLQLIHLAQQTPKGLVAEFTSNAFLKSLNKTAGKNIRLLEESLHRLTTCTLSIRSGRYFGEGDRLIKRRYRDDLTKRNVVYLDEKLAALFREGYTLQNWEQRLSLPQGFSRWMLGYASSHLTQNNQPHRVAVGRLQELCGSRFSKLPHFREKLKKSMQQLQDNGVIKTWRITENDALEFTRHGVDN